MECLTEFTCSVFADGELPDAELRQVEEHVESCPSCRSMAAAFREENRLLVHCIQEIDLARAEAPARVARPSDVAKFGAMLAGVATLIRLATSSPENFVLPASPVSLDWLDPSNLLGSLNWLAGATVLFASDAVSAVTSLVDGLSVVTMYMLILVGIVMLARRSIGKSAMVGVLAALGTILLMIAGAPSSYAMDFRTAGGNKDKVALIPAGEVVDDSLFATGDAVIVDGTINGDLIAFARQVTVHGAVNGNIITGAQTIDVQGTVGGSIIAAGSSIEIDGKVTHNVMGFGQRVTLGKDANVGGDFAAFGNESHVNGDLAHNFYAFGIADIAGSIGRNVVFRGGTISVLPSARITGDLTAHVQRPEAVHIDAGSTIGGKQTVDVSKPGPSKYATFRFYFSQMLHMAAAFITGMILLVLFPGLRRVSFNEVGNTMIAGGIGFLALVAMPIAAIILAITLIGLPVAFAGFIAWLLGLYLAKIIIANFVGRTLFSPENDRLSALALNLFVGVILVAIAINLPYVGGLMDFLLVIVGFGGLIKSVYGSYQSEYGSGR